MKKEKNIISINEYFNEKKIDILILQGKYLKFMKVS